MHPALRLLVAPLKGVGSWPDALASLDLDFAGDRYFWNGSRRQRSDLTIASGAPVFSSDGVYIAAPDKLRTPDLTWFNAVEGTFIVDYDKPTNASGCVIFSMSGTGGNPRLEMFQDGANVQVYGNTTTTFLSGTTPGSPPINSRRGRIVFSLKDGELCSGVRDGSAATTMGATVYTNNQTWTRAGIGYRTRFDDARFLGNVRRLRFFPARLTNAQEMAKALITSKTNPHMLGDSFVTTGLIAGVEANLSNDYRAYSADGVGGSTISAQATRWAATPQFYDRTLIIMDGSGPDEDIASVYLPKLAEIAGRLTSGRWLYVQGGISRLSTPAEVATILANYATIQAAYPANYVPTYDYMRANGTGSTTGINGGEVWAADNYTDDLHPSAMGKANLGACIAAAKTARGW